MSAEKPMAKLALFSLILLTAVGGPVAGGNDACTTDFAPITARGRILAAYDLAARQAYEAIRPQSPPPGSLTRSIVRNTDSGSVVVFGRLNESHDRFLVVYEATQQSTTDNFSIKKNDPPVEDDGFYFLATRAIDTALAVFKPENHPFNSFVLPADAGQMYVYFEPSITHKDSVPLGGDVRYLISADGSTIVEARQMHRSIIEKAPPPPGTKLAGGFHTHVLSDTPEDSDVLYVLRQHPPQPEFIGTANKCLYKVEVDGTIKSAK
jgi:hypothetical protein